MTQNATREQPLAFKEKKSLHERKAEVDQIRAKFPSKIPVIVERYKKERELPPLDKVKFLVPQEFTMSNFCVIVRSKLIIRPSQSMHFIIGSKTVPSMDMSVAELYNLHKDEDGFLYITYASTQMFGSQ